MRSKQNMSCPVKRDRQRMQNHLPVARKMTLGMQNMPCIAKHAMRCKTWHAEHAKYVVPPLQNMTCSACKMCLATMPGSPTSSAIGIYCKICRTLQNMTYDCNAYKLCRATAAKNDMPRMHAKYAVQHCRALTHLTLSAHISSTLRTELWKFNTTRHS